MKRDTRRFTFGNKVRIIDLGLRLADVRELGLEASAEAAFDRGSDSAKRENLRLNGATREEAEFLLKQRVELNALTSDQLVAFIERKLDEHGIKKLIPKADLLRDAYRLFINSKRVEEIVEEAIDDIESENIAVPANLNARVAAYLRQHPEIAMGSGSRCDRGERPEQSRRRMTAHMRLPNRRASLSFGFECRGVTFTLLRDLT